VGAVNEPTVGDVIDARYLLRREIARGAMGIVFEAEHTFTGRIVALKLLHAEHAGSEPLRLRLLREGRVLANVRHRGVVEVRDAGIGRSNEPFVAMEMLEGRPLDGILAARRVLPIDDVLRVGVELCEALAAVHAQDLVHRDVKPSNVFVAIEHGGVEVLKLIDFGIASLPNGPGAAEGRKITMHGELLGTPEYMAPEQLLGLPVDRRADLYAVGVTLYECLTGDVPFGGTYPEILVRVQSDAPTPISALRPDVSPALARVVERAIAKGVDDRFPDAEALAAALRDAGDVLARSRSLPGVAWPPPSADEHRFDGPLATALLGVARAAEPPDVHSAPTRTMPVRTPVLATRADIAVPLHRRRFPRAPYVTPVWISRGGGTIVEGRSEDVSETGLLVITSTACEDGESVRVRFALPGDAGVVTASAVVRWARSARDGRGAFGLEWSGLADGHRRVIADYVRAMTPGRGREA
jgi:serine/threonine protein kinase